MLNIQTSVTTSILYQDYNPMKSRHLNEVIFTHATCLWTGNHRKRQFVIQNGGHWANHSKLKVGGALTGFVHGDYFIISQNKTKSVILRMLSFHLCNWYNDIIRGYYTHDVFVKRNPLKTPIFLCNGGHIAVSAPLVIQTVLIWARNTHLYSILCVNKYIWWLSWIFISKSNS